MAGVYMVNIVEDDEDYGPFSLVSAKAFARIGAKEGRSNRIIWRRDNGRVVREYEAGSGYRLFPEIRRQTHGMTPREIPSDLR